MEGIGHVTLSYSVLIMPRLATGIAGRGAICVTFGGRRQAAGNRQEGVPLARPLDVRGNSRRDANSGIGLINALLVGKWNIGCAPVAQSGNWTALPGSQSTGYPVRRDCEHAQDSATALNLDYWKITAPKRAAEEKAPAASQPITYLTSDVIAD
jgi:hypothetical protein